MGADFSVDHPEVTALGAHPAILRAV